MPPYSILSKCPKLSQLSVTPPSATVRTYLWMEEEAWSWPHVLVFQSLKRIAHSPLLNPANSRFLLALNACMAANFGTVSMNDIFSSIKNKFTIGSYVTPEEFLQYENVFMLLHNTMCNSKYFVLFTLDVKLQYA